MEFYFVLGAATAAITALTALLLLRTRHIGFVVGFGLLYYWSLYGAWSVFAERTGGDGGKGYDYLTEKMFPVDLDEHYMAALVLYAVFILVIQLTLLWLIPPAGALGEDHNRAPMRVSHTCIFILAGISITISFVILADQLTSATEMNVSAYVATRGGLGAYHPLFTIHQTLNRMAVFALAIGLAVYLAGERGVFLAGGKSFLVGWIYAGLLLGTFGFLAMLGNKNELFAALLLGGMVYSINTRTMNWKSVVPIGGLAFLAIGAINFLRSLPVLALLDTDTWWEAATHAPEIRSSGEAFAAHFSLYGMLHFNAPLTYGSSFVSLAQSVVPRLLWADRPLGTYVEYAEGVGIYEGATGEAYTIHHATGWYLNFGLWGLVAGAVLWGLVWGQCYRAYRKTTAGGRGWQHALSIMAPAGFVAAIPLLVRAGPDGYKGVIIEGFIIPTVIILLASTRWGKLFHNRGGSPMGTAGKSGTQLSWKS
jgi:hypothetical protein